MKVGIVDDTTPNLVLMEKLVSRLPDCTPISCDDPRESLLSCAENEPGLIIFDYMTPDMEGLEFIRGMHFDPDCVIVFLDALDDPVIIRNRFRDI